MSNRCKCVFFVFWLILIETSNKKKRGKDFFEISQQSLHPTLWFMIAKAKAPFFLQTSFLFLSLTLTVLDFWLFLIILSSRSLLEVFFQLFSFCFLSLSLSFVFCSRRWFRSISSLFMSRIFWREYWILVSLRRVSKDTFQ